jgi:hypothetical protein
MLSIVLFLFRNNVSDAGDRIESPKRRVFKDKQDGDLDRIQCPKLCVFKQKKGGDLDKNRTMDNVQKYT